MFVRALAAASLFCALVGLTGCGGGTSTIEVKVTNGSAPYSPSKDGDLNVTLTNEGGKSFSSKVDETGSIKIAGLPSGKYSVGATQYPPPNEKQKSPPMPGNKKLEEKWDVSSSSKSFTLDVSKLK